MNTGTQTEKTEAGTTQDTAGQVMTQISTPTEVKNLEANKPNLAGRLASSKAYFGQCARYALFAIHTRFKSVEYVVTDADVLDEITGKPAIIRQGNSVESVMSGFNA